MSRRLLQLPYRPLIDDYHPTLLVAPHVNYIAAARILIDVKNHRDSATFGLSRDPNLGMDTKSNRRFFGLQIIDARCQSLSLWQPPFWLQTAKNSTSGSGGYYVGGSSTLPRGGSLLRAYSPAASSIAGGPSATPTQPKTLTTPGIRMPAFPLFFFSSLLLRACHRARTCT